MRVRRFAFVGPLALASITVIAIAATVGLWLATPSSEPADATALAIGIDANTTGNTSTFISTVNDCREVSLGSFFDVDVYVTGVTDLMAWETWLSFPESKLMV